jgi:2,3-bisphosphoglycerate-dependent phosphoglycerate mutase
MAKTIKVALAGAGAFGIKHLDGISNDDIVGLEIPNGVPVIYELDAELRPISRRFLEA